MTVLANLSPRERTLLLVVLPLALVLAAYALAWRPLQEMRAARESEIAGYRLVALAAAGAGAGTSPGPIEDADAAPLAARVTASAEAAGLALSRLEPEGERLRVAIADAPFAQVVLWMSDLETEEDVTLAAVELDRRAQPGTVSARLLLEAAR